MRPFVFYSATLIGLAVANPCARVSVRSTASASLSAFSAESTSSVAPATPTSSSASMTAHPSTSSSVTASTCTPISWTNTNAFTSNTACPTPYEVGTYCGFINPEDPCAVQPGGHGPRVVPDTVSAFKSYSEFQHDASNAQTPSGWARTFQNLDATASLDASEYLGVHLMTSYDVAGCAAWCHNTTSCASFNIYIERDPSINPSQCSCKNPSSITNYGCTLWKADVTASCATNTGQSRDSFEVVMVASNGYKKSF